MLPDNPGKSNLSWVSDTLMLAVIILIFYTFWLGGYPLFTPDEGRYSEVAREMIATGDYVTPRVNGVAFLDKPILYYWLQALSIHLFGIKEWALRLFPVLFGVFGCLITYLTGRRLFDRRTGLLSAIILATTPLYFISAHYANLDLEVGVLISASLLFFITGVQSEGKSRNYFLMFAWLAAALATLTKGLIGLVFPVMIAGIWIILTSQWKLLARIHLARGLLIFAIIVLPWYYLVQKANPEFLHYFFVTQQFTRFLSTTEFNNPSPLWFYLPIVLAGFFPWTGFVFQSICSSLRRSFKAGKIHQTELFLLISMLVIFLFFSIPRSKIITYILPIFPVLALLTGRYLSHAFHETSKRGITFGILNIVVIGIAFALTLISISHFHWIELPAGFTPHLNVIAIIFIVSAWLLFLLIREKNLLPLFLVSACCSALFLLTLILGAKYLNQNSSKPLVAELKSVIQPADEVVHYFRFYQDVPLYLGQRVAIVADWDSPEIQYNDNWKRELWYGMPFQDTSELLINESTFWKKWNGDKRVFVFLGENYFSQFKKHTSNYYYIAQENGIMLLSNQPTV